MWFKSLLLTLLVSLMLLTSCLAPITISAPATTSTLPTFPPTSSPTPSSSYPIEPIKTTETPPTNTTEAQVTRVIDGDTIEVSLGGETYTVRYIGIDTPETVHPDEPIQPFGPEASAKNKELVEDKVVRLEKDISESDKYGRLLRYVYVGDLFVNAELVRLGYAQVSTYPPDVKYQDLFLQLQQEAREAGAGLWGEGETISTSPTTSPLSTTDAPSVYVGSINSNKYHYPSCHYAKQIHPENEIWFASADDALAKGYIPCGSCTPPTVD